MRRTVGALGIALVLVVAGCGGDGGRTAPTNRPSTTEPTPNTAPMAVSAAVVGVTHGTLDHDGRELAYRLYVPTDLPDDHLVPLVLVLHGGFGSGEQVAETTNYDDQADAAGFVAVYPDGSRRPDGTGARTWNGGRCCGPAMVQDIDDVGFLTDLVGELADRLPIDRDRVFAVGHSNGAIMANRLGCEAPATFRAIGAVAGSLEVPCDDGEPRSVVYIHGDADRNHPLEGGIGPDSVAGVAFTSVADSLDRWAGIDGCHADPTETTEGDVTTSTWSGCADGTTVQFHLIHGGSHAWPGGTPRVSVGGPTSHALDATAVTWGFFAEQ